MPENMDPEQAAVVCRQRDLAESRDEDALWAELGWRGARNALKGAR